MSEPKLNGVYKCVGLSHGYNYDITLSVKETDKSYVFHLLENKSQFSGGQIEMMFKSSNKCVVKKDKSPHAIHLWEDGTFTMYPCRAGIPYYFERAGER